MTTPQEAKANNDALLARLEKVFVKRRIAQYIQERHGKEIINLIIGHAASGLGPSDAAYPKYSPKYDKRKAKTGGGRFLRGIGNTGRSGGMLDPKNFTWETDPQGGLWLVWKAADARMAIYGAVHQEGLPLGKNGPRKHRKWMHLDWEGARKAVATFVENIVNILVQQFNGGQ